MAPRARRCRQRPVTPDRLAVYHQVAAREVRRREVVVARDGDQRAAQPPCHELDKARLATAGGPLEQHREPLSVALLEDLYFVAAWEIEGPFGLCDERNPRHRATEPPWQTAALPSWPAAD